MLMAGTQSCTSLVKWAVQQWKCNDDDKRKTLIYHVLWQRKTGKCKMFPKWEGRGTSETFKYCIFILYSNSFVPKWHNKSFLKWSGSSHPFFPQFISPFLDWYSTNCNGAGLHALWTPSKPLAHTALGSLTPANDPQVSAAACGETTAFYRDSAKHSRKAGGKIFRMAHQKNKICVEHGPEGWRF